VRICYVILAHTLPHQVVRLVERLQTESTIFLIHIDAKAGREVVDPIRLGLEQMANVHFLRRHVCHWGEFGLVAASLEGIRTIVEQRLPCDQAVLLSGQDFPIKSNVEIADVLGQAGDRSHLAYFPLPHDGWGADGGWDRIDRWYVRLRGRRFELPPAWVADRLGRSRRRFLPGLKPFGGPAQWSLSAEALAYVHAYVQRRPEYVSFFQRTLNPDELFFQTLLLNSPLSTRLINAELHHIEWSPGAAHPNVLTVEDFPRLQMSEAMFARKFDSGADADVLNLVEEHILHEG
jgi:hypothetical protein